MDIGYLVKELRSIRQRKKLTLKEVAARGNFANESAVQRLETATSNPTLRSIQRYAAALEATIHLEVSTMQVLTFFNHAGGVGKTSTVRDLGYCLTEYGFKVLVIDTDPQATLTNALGFNHSKISISQTIAPAVLSEEPSPLPQPLSAHGMDLIPSTLKVAELEVDLLRLEFAELRLKDSIGFLKGYDFVLIDCPPVDRADLISWTQRS